MAATTGIEWCDATFNPWWGCERVSPGCAHCYADTFARRVGMGDLWEKRGEHGFRFFGDKHWAEPEKWARTLPAKLGRRPRVFCASMADVFEARPELDEHRARLFRLIAATPELDWLILTKRPENARDLWGRLGDELHEMDVLASIESGAMGATVDYRWPLTNVWLGVSIENARHVYRARVLREIPAAVRFISAEPLLGPLTPTKEYPCFTPPVTSPTGTPSPPSGDASAAAGHPASGGSRRATSATTTRSDRLSLDGIDWVIVGGESGPRARPMSLQWARELVDACRGQGVACFVKQLGEYAARELGLRDRKGGNPDEWPTDLRVREMPR